MGYNALPKDVSKGESKFGDKIIERFNIREPSQPNFTGFHPIYDVMTVTPGIADERPQRFDFPLVIKTKKNRITERIEVCRYLKQVNYVIICVHVCSYANNGKRVTKQLRLHQVEAQGKSRSSGTQQEALP